MCAWTLNVNEVFLLLKQNSSNDELSFQKFISCNLVTPNFAGRFPLKLKVLLFSNKKVKLYSDNLYILDYASIHFLVFYYYYDLLPKFHWSSPESKMNPVYQEFSSHLTTLHHAVGLKENIVRASVILLQGETKN